MFGRLYIEEGGRPARMIELTGAVTIGRTADNDIVLESDGVSHYHAMLFAQPDGVTLLDLGSTFGTFVDTVQALPDEPMRLPNGARITIGRALLRYTAPLATRPRSAANGHDSPKADPHDRPPLVAPSLNTRFQGMAPNESFPVGQRKTLLIWVGAPILSGQWQSSRSFRWNGELNRSLALRVRVRAASPAWSIVAEEPTVLVEPWGSARIARYQVMARRPERTKLVVSVEHADSGGAVQHLLLGVNAAASLGSDAMPLAAGALAVGASLATAQCQVCGAMVRAEAKFCPACGQAR
ncbi:MAG TPA: FHA domain-containing protein [Roseiflexaceae bacterium]|nr:FHA domain-containing protein [Roseiflexaceae bacterium]